MNICTARMHCFAIHSNENRIMASRMQIKDYFERIYAINLPHRGDRRNAIRREMANAGLPLTPGKIEIFSAVRPDDAAGFPGIGVRGCFLSHLSILKHAQATGLANVLVMEDDLTISEEF